MLSPYTLNGFSLLWDKVSYLTKVPKSPLIAIDSRPYHPVLILIQTPASCSPCSLDSRLPWGSSRYHRPYRYRKPIDILFLVHSKLLNPQLLHPSESSPRTTSKKPPQPLLPGEVPSAEASITLCSSKSQVHSGLCDYLTNICLPY